MHEILDCLNIFLIPPILFLITGAALGIFSLIHGKRQYENVLFALICLWYSLLMPVFISHHLFKGNLSLIMKIERSIHVIYVYGPAILILFVHSVVDKKNRIVEIGAFLFSFIISLSVFTDYYFYGMWEFPWGYIARGGIIFQLFGLWALSAIVYSFILSIKKLKTDIDSHTRLKIKYIMFAILSIGILTIGNMPALNGINLYPPGNFAFISMLIMAWGIYRHDVIRINLYTKRRIAGTIVRIFVITSLIAAIPVCWWALDDYSLSYIAGKTIQYGIPPLLSFICCVFLLFLSLRMGENRKDSIIFSLLMLVYAILSIDIYLNIIITIPSAGLSISRLSHLFVIFIPALAMHMIRIVTNRHSERWLLIGVYILTILLLLFSQSDYYLQDMYIYSWGMFAKKAVLFDLMGIFSALALFYCIVILIVAYKQEENRSFRYRFIFLLIGSSSIALMSLGNIPAMNGYDLYPIGNFIFIPATLFAIALFRHNILELIRLIGIFLYYTLISSAIITAIYILSSKHSDNLLPFYAGISISGILIFNYFLRRLRDALTGRHINRLKIAFENLSDKLSRTRNITEISECISHSFFIDLYCGHCAVLLYEEISHQYSGNYLVNPRSGYIYNLPGTLNSSSIIIEDSNPLLNYIHTKHSLLKLEEIEFYILNDGLNVAIDDPLRKSELILPVFFENQLSAIILLGVKTDGSVYSFNEKVFLYQLGINLGPHIENVRILQRLEETLAERTHKLRISEEKYRHLIENANEIIYKVDWIGNLIYANPAFQKKSEYTSEEITNLNYLDFILPENRDIESTYYREQLKNKIDESHRELPIRTKSGKVLWVDQSIKSIKDNSGRIVEFDIILHDITDRKSAEDALRESEKHYQQLMENVSDCVFICKPDGYFKYVNQAITRLTGSAPDDLIGTHFLQIVHPDYHERIIKFYQDQIREKTEITYCEFPLLIKNNEIKWISQTVRMTRNSEGEIEFYGITRDISALKKAEDARRDLEEAKTRFFANISHEIRTPLTLMLGPIESVLQGDYDREIDNNFFKTLHRNTLSLLKLVNNLLDFSKIEAGKMTLRVQQGDIVYFARHYLSSIQLAGKSKNINLELNSTPDSINIFFDPEKMDKVFMNLLSNALKFTGSGGTISIDISENESHCRIAVSDTGEGIPGNSLNTIFDRFSQVDSTSTRKYEGTGIGLALVRELVELHGGLIEVESRYAENYPDNHGSSFTITIPKGAEHFTNKSNIVFDDNINLDDYVKDYRLIGLREIEASKIADTSSELFTYSGKEAGSYNKKKVLVVDDNEDMRNFLRILLQKKYNVLFAENGDAGIICAKKNKPDIIVTDVMMPVMNGIDMTSIIKNDNELKTIPVIMLTADTELMNKVAGLENGADDYLHKPFNSIELLTRISSLLKNYENQQIINRRNAEIERELEVARLLQERLLPVSMPDIPGYHGHAIYIPMDKIGGDFYDIENRDGLINVFIADVSGHGLPGAFLATITKIALENITDRTSSKKLLYLLNDVILRHTVQSNFVTAFFTTIDTRTNVMQYSCAGHSAPFLYRKKNDEFIELKTKGIPLGWFDDIQIDEKIIQLEQGDRLVFYTDGVTECSDSLNNLFGDERLQGKIKEYSAMPAEIFTDELIKELETFHGGNNFNDDVTMVVVDIM